MGSDPDVPVTRAEFEALQDAITQSFAAVRKDFEALKKGSPPPPPKKKSFWSLD